MSLIIIQLKKKIGIRIFVTWHDHMKVYVYIFSYTKLIGMKIEIDTKLWHIV